MRVIAGILKGRKLLGFQASHIRPTTDRVKETLFNILRNDIPDARVLDLFSGTGNLGIEAYSRGAGYVECVESSRQSLQIIRENLEHLKIQDKINVRAKDVFRYLKEYEGEIFQVVFIDPPFDKEWADSSMAAIAESPAAGPGTLVVIESRKKELIKDTYGPFQLLDRRQFGDKSASIFVRKV